MAWKDVTKNAVDYLSHTQIAMMRRCPKQYEFRYIKGIKQKPTGPLVLGSSVHKGIEHNYAHKFKKKKAARLDECQSAFADTFEKSKSGVDFEGKKPGVVKDVGYQMTEMHYLELAPTVTPLEMPEKQFMISLPGVTKKIKGFIDVVGKLVGVAGKAIIDNKTAGRMKTEFEVDIDDQLTTYAIAEEQTTGTKASHFGFDVITPKGTRRIMSKRGPERTKDLIETVVAIEKMLKVGAFPPTSNNMTCSWCGYRSICPTAKNARSK